MLLVNDLREEPDKYIVLQEEPSVFFLWMLHNENQFRSRIKPQILKKSLLVIYGVLPSESKGGIASLMSA